MPKAKVHMTLREAILQGVLETTENFNQETFPQKNDDWTPEQKAIWDALNGESSWFTTINDSHKPEVKKQLIKLAGIEGMESRFEMNKSVTVPPNVMIVLREGRDGYPASFPLLHGRIQGYWLENGTGGSSDIETLTVKKLRPATVDDIRSFMKNFPESKLPKLAHSIKISNENKLRELVTALVTKATAELRAQVEYHWPEGLTEKGIKILEAGRSTAWRIRSRWRGCWKWWRGYNRSGK